MTTSTIQTLIPVYLGTVSKRNRVADVDLGEFKDAKGAQPTNRVLDGSDDHGYAQEWSERGTLRGQTATLIYLFDDADICDENGEEIEDAEHFPWEKAAARIIVEDWEA